MAVAMSRHRRVGMCCDSERKSVVELEGSQERGCSEWNPPRDVASVCAATASRRMQSVLGLGRKEGWQWRRLGSAGWACAATVSARARCSRRIAVREVVVNGNLSATWHGHMQRQPVVGCQSVLGA